MDFSVEQDFGAAPAEVIGTFADPGFYALLGELDRIHPPVVVSHDRDDPVVRLEVRFQAAVELPGTARRFVRDDLLSWVEHSEHDLDRHRGRFEIVPEHYRHLFEASGTVDYRKRRGGTRRIIRGNVRVKVPFVGSRAERAVVDGLQDQVDAAAAIVERWLDGDRS